MSDVRTQIRNIIWNTYAAGYRDGRNGDNEDVADLTRGRADRIIALVREAMLSDEAVEAYDDACMLAEASNMPYPNINPMAAALDTAFGPDSDQAD